MTRKCDLLVRSQRDCRKLMITHRRFLQETRFKYQKHACGWAIGWAVFRKTIVQRTSGRSLEQPGSSHRIGDHNLSSVCRCEVRQATSHNQATLISGPRALPLRMCCKPVGAALILRHTCSGTGQPCSRDVILKLRSSSCVCGGTCASA